jgi:hypothetical protein
MSKRSIPTLACIIEGHNDIKSTNVSDIESQSQLSAITKVWFVQIYLGNDFD